MSRQSLLRLVRIYQRKHGPRIADYLDYFQKLNSLDDVIRYACHGKDGEIHPHQHLVGKEKLEQARRALERHSDEISACKSFDELHTLVEDRVGSIDRFGVLAVYDTSLRIGAHLKLWPEVVFLHAGTRKGCKALGVVTRGGKVALENLPRVVQSLEAYQAEDFLCIFKDEFSGARGKAKECGDRNPSPRDQAFRRP